MIAAACVGSLYGGQSHVFIGTVVPFLACHWYDISPLGLTSNDEMEANVCDLSGPLFYKHAG